MLRVCGCFGHFKAARSSMEFHWGSLELKEFVWGCVWETEWGFLGCKSVVLDEIRLGLHMLLWGSYLIVGLSCSSLGLGDTSSYIGLHVLAWGSMGSQKNSKYSNINKQRIN